MAMRAAWAPNRRPCVRDQPIGVQVEDVPHPIHHGPQLRIDRGAPRVTVEWRQMRTNAAQVDEAIDRAQQVVLRNVVFQREVVEQRALHLLPRSHHRRHPRQDRRIESAITPQNNRSFSTEYPRCRHSLHETPRDARMAGLVKQRRSVWPCRQSPERAECAASFQIDGAEARSMDMCSYKECSSCARDSSEQVGLPRDAKLTRQNAPENGAIQDTDQ